VGFDVDGNTHKEGDIINNQIQLEDLGLSVMNEKPQLKKEFADKYAEFYDLVDGLT